ncbi:MarR family winged helix-turn-helix transcriptional regulator [Saccharopolyspora shandongensis]|uniref:MarR family winged helix-turn-helix transcriptional regulator n=1 Tax=Saccharopolyspora shandongensis TaxID=418495 RepID=UPI003F4D5F80
MVAAVEKTPARLTARPSWLLTQLAVHVHRLVTDGFGEAGARGYHYRILAALDEFGVASQAELGRRCNMDRSDVVAAINELAEQGFVERTPDPDDRRRNLVTLTKAGDRQLRRLDRALDEVQDDLLGPLPAEDRQTLTRLLTRLLAHHQRG